MIRMQIQLDERQLRALREQAALEHASMSEIVRRAVDSWLAGHARPGMDERRRRPLCVRGAGHRRAPRRLPGGCLSTVIFVDTSAFFAILDRDDQADARAREALTSAATRCVLAIGRTLKTLGTGFQIPSRLTGAL